MEHIVAMGTWRWTPIINAEKFLKKMKSKGKCGSGNNEIKSINNGYLELFYNLKQIFFITLSIFINKK